MVVRKAKLNDLDSVQGIAELSSDPTGISFPLTKEQYYDRLNPLFLVAAEDTGRLVGFVVFMQAGLCRSLVERAKILGRGPADTTLMERCLPERILDSGGDQEVAVGMSIAVHPDFRRCGVARSLLGRVISELPRFGVLKMFVPIRHEPDPNLASMSLCRSLGLRYEREEVVFGVVWGIYSMDCG